MDPVFLAIQVLNGVQYGLLLFLIAAGLTLIFGIMGIINLAHGSFYMVGAYLAHALGALTGNFWTAILLGTVLTLVLGYALERGLISRLYDRDHLYQVLFTYGLILAIEECRSILFGDDVHGVPVPRFLSATIPLTDNFGFPVYRLFAGGVCGLLALALWLVIARTRIGMIVRAGSVNREMVQSLGIDIRLVYAAVFAVGTALAAFAGMIAAPLSSVYPGMGGQVLIVSFVVVVVGGIGSVRGAFLAALLIGLADTFGKALFPQAASVAVYLVMAAILVLRPEGLVRRLG